MGALSEKIPRRCGIAYLTLACLAELALNEAAIKPPDGPRDGFTHALVLVLLVLARRIPPY